MATVGDGREQHVQHSLPHSVKSVQPFLQLTGTRARCVALFTRLGVQLRHRDLAVVSSGRVPQLSCSGDVIFTTRCPGDVTSTTLSSGDVIPQLLFG